jgi:hypothetical protein
VPGPSPWYIEDGASPVDGFTWRHTDRGPLIGKTLLVGADGPVAVLNPYNWVLSLDSSTLLIWSQPGSSGSPTGDVELRIVRPAELAPIEGPPESIDESVGRDMPLLLGGCESSLTRVQTTRVDTDLEATFPDELQRMEELLILCGSSGIRAGSVSAGNLCLLVAMPARSRYRLYPQDWFNNGDFDYGYQWVTRVARDPLTKRIHGEGIRISPFLLDRSLRHIV